MISRRGLGNQKIICAVFSFIVRIWGPGRRRFLTEASDLESRPELFVWDLTVLGLRPAGIRWSPPQSCPRSLSIIRRGKLKGHLPGSQLWRVYRVLPVHTCCPEFRATLMFWWFPPYIQNLRFWLKENSSSEMLALFIECVVRLKSHALEHVMGVSFC